MSGGRSCKLQPCRTNYCDTIPKRRWKMALSQTIWSWALAAESEMEHLVISSSKCPLTWRCQFAPSLFSRKTIAMMLLFSNLKSVRYKLPLLPPREKHCMNIWIPSKEACAVQWFAKHAHTAGGACACPFWTSERRSTTHETGRTGEEKGGRARDKTYSCTDLSHLDWVLAKPL